MDILHPTPEEMVAALLAAAEAGWWCLDGGRPDGPLEAREVTVEMWEQVEAAPVAMTAEERASYKVQSHDE